MEAHKKGISSHWYSSDAVADVSELGGLSVWDSRMLSWMLLDRQFVTALFLRQTSFAGSPLSSWMTRLPFLFLQVDSSELQNSLTNLSIIVRGESVSRPLSVAQAADGRDAFVKVLVPIYSLFKIGNAFKAVCLTSERAFCDKYSPSGLCSLLVFRHSLTSLLQHEGKHWEHKDYNDGLPFPL